MSEGIDFSSGGIPTPKTLHNNGKSFVGRYAVDDKSPGGRGVTAAEYHNYVLGGIDMFIYWEGRAQWMIGGTDENGNDAGPGGFAAGVAAAKNAQANLIGAGMPPTMPIYFAHDIDPETRHFSTIDDCLRGAASVVGWDRVGVYGGWLLIDYMAQGGTVKWLCQTIAWEYGHGLHPKATLYQYRTNNVEFDGVDCDLVRALVPNYGQASKFLASAPKPEVVYGKPAGLPAYGPRCVPYKHTLTVKEAYQPRAVASLGGKPTGPTIPVTDPKTKKPTEIRTTRLIIADDNSLWVTTAGGSRHPLINLSY